MEYWSSRLMFLITLVLLLSQSLIDSSTPSPSNNLLCHPAESSALLQFSNSFIINPSMFDFVMKPKTVSWKNGTDCCSWDGVSCDHISGHVIGLNLSSSGLQGPLHSNSTLFSLPHLQTLILDHNNFSCSPIPPEIGSFPNMKTLSLFFANFSGYVPEEISHLSKLSYLTICGNFDDSHLLMGPFVLKKMLQNFTNLMELIMINIDMSGVELVSSFMNVSSSLTTLDLSWCGLRGKFPEYVFRLPNLQELALGTNPYSPFSGNLTGSLPMFNWSSPLSFKGSSNNAMLTNLTQLVELISLCIDSNNLGGQIPLFFLNLQQLAFLDLSRNNFAGKIPEFPKANSSQSPLQLNLRALSIFDNLLSESIPSWIPNSIFQQKNLLHLDLSHNNLDGVLELNKFSMLKNLQSLDLSFNNFTVSTHKYTNNDSFPQLSDLGLASCNIREFPYFLKNMKSLQTLQLSQNQIQGRIPEWLWNEGTCSLSRLNISHNFLTSVQKIPCKSLDTVDLRSNMIQGPLPTVPPSVTIFFISNNALSG
ncbi:receptor-like protein 6 [Humulus lupulus]|uniref:receptor-like protein 6 n=1 Tax=Humulus lupulus TaxID=3486 RepID=UPI002B40EC64|nr:receptor-like protein 6 [Humulus lupulus]